MDDEQFEVVEHFKYIGSLNQLMAIVNNDTKSRIGMPRKECSIWLDLLPIWRDRGINKEMTI